MQQACLLHGDGHPLAVDWIEATDHIADRYQPTRHYFEPLEMPPNAFGEAKAADLTQSLRALDGIVDRRRSQTPHESDEALLISWRPVTVSTCERHHPAVVLHRNQDAAADVGGRRRMQQDAFPIARSILRYGENSPRIANVDTDRSCRWGKSDGFQQRKCEVAAPGSVDNQLCRQHLAPSIHCFVLHAGNRGAVGRRRNSKGAAILMNQDVVKVPQALSQDELDQRP